MVLENLGFLQVKDLKAMIFVIGSKQVFAVSGTTNDILSSMTIIWMNPLLKPMDYKIDLGPKTGKLKLFVSLWQKYYGYGRSYVNMVYVLGHVWACFNRDSFQKLNIKLPSVSILGVNNSGKHLNYQNNESACLSVFSN